MKSGVIPESIFKRSVLKKIRPRRVEVIQGAGICRNASILNFSEGNTVFASVSNIGAGENVEFFLIKELVTSLASYGAEPIAVSGKLILPDLSDEKEIKEIVGNLEKECQEENMEIIKIDVEMSPYVTKEVINLQGVGMRKKDCDLDIERVSEGMDIVFCGYAGIQGTLELIQANRESLERRFSSLFLNQALKYKVQLSKRTAAQIAMENKAVFMYNKGVGGVFQALWDIGSGTDNGLEVEMKKIPLCQETIEITEYLEVNPYKLHSGGLLVIITENGKNLINTLKKNNQNAVLGGKITSEKARTLITQEGKRYLESK